MSQQLTFCVAGLEVAVQTSPGTTIPGFYREVAGTGGPPDLVVEVETVTGLGLDRARGREFPGFQQTLVDLHTLALDRFDAEGRITFPDRISKPVRATFKVAESPHSLEAAIRIATSVTLPRHGGLILHASAIARAGKSLVFLGVSGAGKSTIAAMLATSVPGSIKISDELVALRADESGAWNAYVTPFLGDPALSRGTHRAVGELHFLRQAARHEKLRMSRANALRELLRHVLVYAAVPRTAAQVLEAASHLVASVPCYRLDFMNDPGVVDVLGLT